MYVFFLLGIFISPKGIIQEVDSIGLSLVVWILCGLLSMIGALCYAELGTMIPKSGGDYAYINEAFGPLPAFLYLWAANLIFVYVTNSFSNFPFSNGSYIFSPSTNAIMGLTFAKYVVQPFFPQCPLPEAGIMLVAAATITFLSFLNGYSVRSTTKMQNLFMFCKVGALVLVIVVGIVWMGFGNVEHFNEPFKGSTDNVGKIAKAFYSGIFSYSGWNYLNFMTEELKNPYV